MNKNYFLPRSTLAEIADINPKLNFNDTYNKYKDIFMTPFQTTSKIQQDLNLKSVGWLITLCGKDNTVYSGELWQNKKINYIGLMDYLFTVPNWDWWLSPAFPREDHRRNNESIILTDDISYSEFEQICKIVENEGYSIRDKINMNNNSNDICDILRVKNMIEEIFPLKLAVRIAELKEVMASKNNYFFVMRSGKFIRDLIGADIPDSHVRYLDHSTDVLNISDDDLIIDDCIGTGATLEKIITHTNHRHVNLFAIDSTLPSREYSKKFSDTKFNLPESYLNIYCCRLFEENLGLLGDSANFRINDVNNLVRIRLTNKIRAIMKNDINTNYSLFLNNLLSVKNFDMGEKII